MWSTANFTKAYVGDSAGDYSAIDLPVSARAGISEMIKAYTILNKLPDHKVWWTTNHGAPPADLVDAKPPEQPVEEPAELTITETMDWTLNSGELLNAKLKSFQGHRIEFSTSNGNSKFRQIEQFDETTRQKIAELRMAHSLQSGWHPYDDQYTWFWPTKWPQHQRKDRNLILFTIEKSSGQPHLFF